MKKRRLGEGEGRNGVRVMEDRRNQALSQRKVEEDTLEWKERKQAMEELGMEGTWL